MATTAAERLFGLGGRRVVVTGASSGIGRASAETVAALGADVVLWGRSADSLDATAEACRAVGAAVEIAIGDLRDPESCATVARALGRVDGLVNAAGIIARAPAEETERSAWRDVLTVNLDATFAITQAIGAGMLERGSGAIVTIASLLSYQGGITVPAYAASKHAVLGMTRALSNEWAGRGVRVTAVSPGYVATDNTAALRADPEREASIRARIPMGRWAEASDIAGAVAFLLSDAAAYITGEALVVDGGWMAR